MSLLKDKSYNFALHLVKSMYAFQKENKEFILTRQLIRSGTSVGAMIEEAGRAESKADFIHKLSIANKEANETRYWLRLLRDSGIYTKSDIQGMLDQVDELIRMLVASIKTAKLK